MKIFLMFSVFLLLSGFMFRTPSSRAQDGAAQAKFFSEYKSAEKKIREFYGNATMRANHLAKGDGNEQETLDSEILFKGALPLLRIDITRRAEARGRPVGRVSTMVAGHYAFHVVKSPEAAAFALQGGMGDLEKIDLSIREHGKVFFAPFAFLQDPILDLFVSADFYVKDIVDEQRDGRKLVKVTWGRKDPATSAWQGWFLFSPNESWALQEYWFRSIKADYFTRAVLAYSGKSGDIPLLKKVTYQRTDDNGKLLMAQIYEVTEFRPGAVAESEFRLSAFGLPEPAGANQSPSTWYLWFIAIAVVSLGIGGFFWRRVQRRKTMAVANAAKGK